MGKKTEYLDAQTPEGREAAVKRAAEILRTGGLVVLPTETVYGIGANALDEGAVAGIFKAKGRPQDNPLIVHACDEEDISPLVASYTEPAKKLAKAFWPGPLTMILPKSQRVPLVTSGGLDTVAVRMPSHPIAQEIIKMAGVPVAAPSANRSGSPSPTTAAHCTADLDGRVDLIVDGGDCQVGVESTVVSLSGDTPLLLRPGGVTLEQLRQVLGQVEVDPAVTARLQEGRAAASPGMKYRHYAPSAKVILVHGTGKGFANYVNGKMEPGIWALAFEEDTAGLKVPCISYGGELDREEQARRLFSALRQLDDKGARTVYVRPPARDGMGLAVYNRLLRAAGFQEIFL